MKLIDKDKVVAEIEKRQEEEVSYDEDGSFASWADHNHYSTLESIKEFINTLEVKEVDLDEEFNKCCENYIFDDEWEEYTAKHFFKLGIKATQKGE